MRLTERVLLVTVMAVTIAYAQDDPPGRVGRLNYVSGTVSFQPAGVDDWVPANLNRPLTTGDHLWVEPNSRAELHLGSSALRLNGNTAFQFLNLDDRAVQIRLSEGTLIVRLRRLADDEAFEVDTPNLAFSLLRPGEYRIDANPENETTTITVRSGEGEVTGVDQAFPVRADQMARVTGDQTVTYDVLGAPSPDYFEEWALSRDRLEDRSESARYVSRDVIGYEDLDANGDWRPVAEYGTVWVPRRVPAGWAPYRFGHWAWIEPWGWTWVDDAPWGFAPFHYGRWAFVTGTWAWVPGPIAVRPMYAPALVAWVGGPRFNVAISIGGGGPGVGWFPLGPREVYVPAYRASPTYVTRVNTTNTVINNINVTNVRYVNRSAPNAVTVVPREALMHARPVAQAAVPVQAQALENAQVMRTSEVAPSRDSVLGRSVGSAASAPHPPAAVMNRPVVARATPPPPQVPFESRRQALAASPGQPLDRATLSRMRAEQPTPVRPLVRQTIAPAGTSPAYRMNRSRQSINAPVQNEPNRVAEPAQQPARRFERPATAQPPSVQNEPNRVTEPAQPPGRRFERPATAQPPSVQNEPNRVTEPAQQPARRFERPATAQPPSRESNTAPVQNEPNRVERARPAYQQPQPSAPQPPSRRTEANQPPPERPARREERSQPAERREAKPEKPANKDKEKDKEDRHRP